MAGRAGRRGSDINDDRPPEPPPPSGVSQRSRFSSEGGRGRSEHNIPDEGLSGIVAPVRAKQPRESSPTPATRLPGGRDGRADRSQSASRRTSSGGRGSQRDSPRRQSAPGVRSGRPAPPPPPSASKASKSPPSAGEPRKSPARPPAAKSPPPPSSYAGEERERRALPQEDRRQSRTNEQRPTIRPTSSPSGGSSQKGGSASRANSPQQRQGSLNGRRSSKDSNLLAVEPPLLAGDTPVDPEDITENAGSGIFQETTDDEPWARGASLGSSLTTPTEAPSPMASHKLPMGGGFEFGTWPSLGHPVVFPGPVAPGVVQGMAPIQSFLAPQRFAAGFAAPRALVPPLPLGSAVDLAKMSRGGAQSPLNSQAVLSPTLNIPPAPQFPTHSMSMESSAWSIAPSSPMRTPSGEFRAVPAPLASVPPPLAMVQFAQPAWAPGSPKGALRSGRALSTSRPSSPMRVESRRFGGEEGVQAISPSEQLLAASKAPLAIPLRSSAGSLSMSFPQLRAPQRLRSLSPRPLSPGPARRSPSPKGIRQPSMPPANLKPFHWAKPGQFAMPAPPSPLRRPMQVNAGFSPPVIAARSMSPMQRSPRGFAWSSPVRGGGVVRVGSPLRSGTLSPSRTSSRNPSRSPPRSPIPGSPIRPVVVPNSPAGMLSYAGSGARQNMYASSESHDYSSGPSRRLSEQAASPEQETAYPRSPTGSPRLEADEPIRPNLMVQPETLRPNLKIQPETLVKAGSLQKAEEDFMRRWRDLQSTDGEDEPEALVTVSPTNGKAGLAGNGDPAAAVVTDNVLEPAGKRRGSGSPQRKRPGQPAQRRAGR